MSTMENPTLVINESYCTGCDKTFKSKRGLLLHQSKSKCGQGSKINQAGTPSPSALEVRNHNEIDAKEEGVAHEDICTNDVISSESYCNGCEKTFKSKRGLLLYQSKSKCGQGKRTEQRIDSSPQPSLESLRESQITTDVEESIALENSSSNDILDSESRCNSCGKTFKGLKGLRLHQSKSKCGQGSKDEQTDKTSSHSVLPDVSNSQIITTEEGDITLENNGGSDILDSESRCNSCGKTFKGLKGLRLHQSKSKCGQGSKDEQTDKTSSHSVLPDVSNSQTISEEGDITRENNVGSGKDRTKLNLKLPPAVSMERRLSTDSGIESFTSRQSNFDHCLPNNIPLSPDAYKDIQFVKKEIKITRPVVKPASEVINKFVDGILKLLKDKDLFPEPLDIGKLNSGSYYDKTKNSEPDEFDVMFFPENLHVTAEFNNSHHGYCKIKLKFPRAAPSALRSAVSEDGYLIPEKFKRILFDMFEKILKSEKFHPGRRTKKKEREGESPAYTVLNSDIPSKIIDIDLVPCIQIEEWPEIFSRIQPNWKMKPSETAKCMEKYHVVAKTCPDEGVKDRDLLWRISFSWAEKQLILKANCGILLSCRKDVFKHLKSVLEKTKAENPEKIKKLCSYHLKMFMLKQFDDWPTEDPRERLFNCMRKLNLFLGDDGREPCIQNYFIPEDNVVKYVPREEFELFRARLQKEIKSLSQNNDSDPSK